VSHRIAEGTQNAFSTAFGYQPAGVWSAPGRVNLIGEHTDYNEGFVLPFAINRRTYAAVATRRDTTVRVTSTFAEGIVEIELNQISPETVSGWAAYPLGVVWAIREAAKGAGTGLDILIDSDVPVGAGLSSSAAIECSVATALNDLWSLGLSKRDLYQGALAARPKI
jgi:galactokinase